MQNHALYTVPLIWPLYLALSEYSAIPLFLHMLNNVKVVDEKKGLPVYLVLEKCHLKTVGACVMDWAIPVNKGAPPLRSDNYVLGVF